MKIASVLKTLNEMVEAGVIYAYAIGGAVGATFSLDPIATIDVDVFVNLKPPPGRLIIDPQPIFAYLAEKGHAMEGEYVVVDGWPVRFLPPPSPLGEEALAQALELAVDGAAVRVFTAEHLAAICLETGRSKDKARLLQFIESGVMDVDRFQAILNRHGLQEAWQKFREQFL